MQKNQWDLDYDLIRRDSGSIKPDLAIDQNNTPHIVYSYLLYNNPTLYHATKTSTGWSLQMTSIKNPYYASLVFDNNNTANIFYTTIDGFYYMKGSGIQGSHFLDSDSVYNPKLSMDVNGDLNLVYYNSQKYSIIYAKRLGNIWNKETIVNTGSFLTLLSMDVDNNGNPHVLYYSANTKNLIYTFLELPTASASPLGGTYNSDISITLSMIEDGSIYYTRNGTNTNSKKWLALEKDNLEDLIKEITNYERMGYTIHSDSFNTTVLLKNSGYISNPGSESIIYGGNFYTILVSK